MITNNDKVGDWYVVVESKIRAVNSFSCPTIQEAEKEARRIAATRRARGLPSRAFRREIKGYGKRGMKLGHRIPVAVS